MSDTPQLRLFDDQPVSSCSLSVSGTIDCVDHKPNRPLGVLTSGVALVEYHVERTVLGASKLGVGLNQGEQAKIRRFYPLADQAAGRTAIDAMEAEVYQARLSGQVAGCEAGPGGAGEDVDRALRLAQ